MDPGLFLRQGPVDLIDLREGQLPGQDSERPTNIVHIRPAALGEGYLEIHDLDPQPDGYSLLLLLLLVAAAESHLLPER